MTESEIRRAEKIRLCLEAFASGDALGMASEFMTREEIEGEFGQVRDFIPPERSAHHSNLPSGSVTDDTEQVLALLESYCEEGKISADLTARSLQGWIRETGAAAKGYIGPSSLKALEAISRGVPPEEAGKDGTTCGGIMRVGAAAFCAWSGGFEKAETLRVIRDCLLPTHFSSQALEAAGAYAGALICALETGDREKTLDAAIEWARLGKALGPWEACGASSESRIGFLRSCLAEKKPDERELRYFLYNVQGTGLPSADVCGAVFGIFMYCGSDVWRALRLGASIGGDTDTIAALAGALCAACGGGHNIPPAITEKVVKTNNLDLDRISRAVVRTFKIP
jgi:ADP-ribosylglycohydrolase